MLFSILIFFSFASENYVSMQKRYNGICWSALDSLMLAQWKKLQDPYKLPFYIRAKNAMNSVNSGGYTTPKKKGENHIINDSHKTRSIY